MKVIQELTDVESIALNGTGGTTTIVPNSGDPATFVLPSVTSTLHATGTPLVDADIGSVDAATASAGELAKANGGTGVSSTATFPAAGEIPVAEADSWTASWYSAATHTDADIWYQVTGDRVTLTIEGFTVYMGNPMDWFDSYITTTLPAELRPADTQYFHISVYAQTYADYAEGILTVSSSGLSLGIYSNNMEFPVDYNCGLGVGCSITYKL